MNVILAHQAFRPFEARLRERLGPAHPLRFVAPADIADPGIHFQDTHVLVAARFEREWSRRFPNLRLLHAAGAGLEKIDRDALPPCARLCRTAGHGASIAEFVLMSMLALSRGLVTCDRELRQNRWHSPQWQADLPLADSLAGKKLVLLGTGEIGRDTARLGRSFQMSTIGLNRSGRVPDGAFDEVHPIDSLTGVLARADFLVVALPLTNETRGLIGKAELARLRPAAFIINVARGPIIEEEALFDALSGGGLAGAALDVWYAYPNTNLDEAEPSRFPFRNLRNVIMTPHISGFTRATFAHRVEDVADNILALAEGRPLRNEVTLPARGRSED